MITNPWRNRKSLSLMLILFTCIVGCQTVQTSSQIYRTSATGYATTLNAIVDLSRGDLVSLPDMERVNEIRISADRLFDEWEASIIAGEEFSGIVGINAILNELIRIEITSRHTGGNEP